MKNIKMNKQKMQEEKAVVQEKFNSVTTAAFVENQNQTYNIKKEALGPNGKR